VLTGNVFDLEVGRTPVSFTGKPGSAVTIDGATPAPTLRWREGETVTVNVTNRLDAPTSVDWHGILVPYDMDGVPGIYGAIVIEPARPDPVEYDRDHTIALSDWTDTNPMRIFQRLKKVSHCYNFNQRTFGRRCLVQANGCDSDSSMLLR